MAQKKGPALESRARETSSNSHHNEPPTGRKAAPDQKTKATTARPAYSAAASTCTSLAVIGERDSLPNLLPQHRRELRASGLSDQTIIDARISSETRPHELAELLNWNRVPPSMVPAMVFPFTNRLGVTRYYRVKPDTPRTVNGKPAKYESPRGQSNEIYLPPSVASLLEDPTRELLITEGEKKSLKATQEGFPCVGLVGVYGWKVTKSERLLPALERIAWPGRAVYIVYDSDAVDNPQVRGAEARLAKHLADRGAKVLVVRLPPGTLGADGKAAKVGLDDFLVHRGSDALRCLLDEAVKPEPVSPAEMKGLANTLDPASEAAEILDSMTCDGLPRLRYWRNGWWHWAEGHYAAMGDDALRSCLIRALNRKYVKLSRRITNDVLDQLQAQAMLPRHVEPPEWLEDPPVQWAPEEVLATSNALVHLPSLVTGASEGDTIEPTPAFFATAALHYEFDAEAPKPSSWLGFLEGLWPGDPPSIALLQEWCGYCLTADTRQQKMLMLIGPPRSGKGTIARVLRELIGPANVAGPALTAFSQQFGLWPLIGKPLAIIPDARLDRKSNQSVVVERLLSITGEDAISIDRKMMSHWDGKLSTRLMMLSNELPRLSDSSGALIGRMLILRLTRSFFGREDKDLTRTLFDELSGILLWAIEGWGRLRQRGRFEQAPSGEELLRELHDLTSPVAHFVRDCCIVDPNSRVPVKELYDAWCTWCRENGRDRPGTHQSVGRDLLAAVPSLRCIHAREGEQRYRAYGGIALAN